MATRSRCECGRVKSRHANECKRCAAARREAYLAESRRIVATGRCPDCGSSLKRNNALFGWWQCEQFLAVLC